VTTTSAPEGSTANGTATTPADVLDWAAAILERDGWEAGSWCPDSDGRGGSCASGAIIRAGLGDPDDALAIEYFPPRGVASAAIAVLADHLGLSESQPEPCKCCPPRSAIWDEPVNRVMIWNDEDGRTAEQVIEALRGAATAIRAAA
jgi:hypothetical protein